MSEVIDELLKHESDDNANEQVTEPEEQIIEQVERLAKREEQLLEEEEEQLTEEEKRFIEKAIENVCKIKAEEFCLQGIKATGKQVWMCVSASYKKGNPNLHEMVKDILGLKSAAFMNWLLVQAQKGIYIP